MSADEIAMWTKAAEDIKTPQVLARIADHNKAIISTVGAVGTLPRRTRWLLAGVAVAVALFGKRPEFAVLNTNNLINGGLGPIHTKCPWSTVRGQWLPMSARETSAAQMLPFAR